MFKFRKMHDGASGPALSSPDDVRFTRLGSFLARTKLDELPQLINVLIGEMSLVGPRPEDPAFVELRHEAYSMILEVRPGITGLSQLAFASETDVLDPDDRMGHYVGRILPQKIGMDTLYAQQRSLGMDLKVLWWTLRAVVGGTHVAVHRETGKLTHRAPRTSELEERSPGLLVQQKAS
jgi:lipopolysaccharide/colanic/teichoic acid biosynthesis glycosyltransferase